METNHCALVVAIEFPVPESGVPARPNSYFERALAQPLANQLAFELGKQLPSLDGLGLVWMAACYDQAQILRPGLPIHAALAALYAAGMSTTSASESKNVAQVSPDRRHDQQVSPDRRHDQQVSPDRRHDQHVSPDRRHGQQVMTLQALRGVAPVPALNVDERLLGGAVVLLPLAIVGAADCVNLARALLEEKLLDTGLADARTALMLNQALGCDAEHARLMTLDDLAALCAVQLEHAGLASVWEILEAAIFRPDEAVSAKIGCAALSWRAGKLSVATSGPGHLSLAEYSNDVLQARQACTVLEAHGLIATAQFCASGTLEVAESFWIDWFTDAQVCEIKVCSDPRLGVVLYQLNDAQGTRIGLVFPRQPSAHRDVLQRFADQAPRLS